MSKFEIRTDLPVPVIVRAHSGRASKYPFAALEIGQSFVIPVAEAPKKGAASIRAATYNFKRTSGSKANFVVQEDDSGNIGVWRIADTVEPTVEEAPAE